MAISFQGVNTAGDSGGTGFSGVTRPTTTTDDVFVVDIYYESTASPAEADFAFSNGSWTEVGLRIQTGSNPDFWHVRYLSRYAGEGATFNITWGAEIGGVWRTLTICAYRGVDTTTAQDATATSAASSGTSTSATAPGLTTATNNALVAYSEADFDGRTVTEPAGSTPTFAERTDFGNLAVATGLLATAGATGDKTGTLASTSYNTAGLLALRPADIPAVESPPTLVGTGTASFTATNGATLAPGLPSGWAVGDLHIMISARSDNTAMTSLDGWTQLYGQNNTTAQRVEVWWRRAQSGDAAPTVTFGSGTVVRGAVIVGVLGAAPTGNPFDVTSILGNSASATVSFTDVTTTGTNRLALAMLAYEDDPTTLSTMGSFTVPTPSTFTSSLGSDMMLGYEHRTLTAQGAAGASSLTVSGGTFANSVNTGVVVTILPDHTALNQVEVRGRPNGPRGHQHVHQLMAQ